MITTPYICQHPFAIEGLFLLIISFGLSPQELFTLTIYSQIAKRSLTHLHVASSLNQWFNDLSPTSPIYTTNQSMLKAITIAMKRGNVFIPSPLRVLRYISENTCEICHVNRPSYTAASVYAVFACHRCFRTRQSLISQSASPALYSTITRPLKHPKQPLFSCMIQYSSSNDYLAKYYMWTATLQQNKVRIGPIVSLQEAMTLAANSGKNIQTAILIHRFKTRAPTKANYKNIIDIYENANDIISATPDNT